MNEEIVRSLAHLVREEIKSENVFSDDLKGACARASYLLQKALELNGIKVVFVLGQYSDEPKFGWDHCWVEIDHFIVDITATQFKIDDEVYICQKYDKRYRLHHVNEEAVRIVNSTWIKEQQIK